MGLLPGFEVAEELGDALEAAGGGVGVDEGEDTLDVDGERVEGGVDVVVDEAGEGAAATVWGVEVGAVDGDPEALVVPDVDEGVVDSGFLAVVPEDLVVVDLDHATVVELLHGVISELGGVPCGDVVRVHLLELPEKVAGALDVGGGDGLADDDVAVGLPVVEVGLREDAEGELFPDLAEGLAGDFDVEAVFAGLADDVVFEDCGLGSHFRFRSFTRVAHERTLERERRSLLALGANY